MFENLVKIIEKQIRIELQNYSQEFNQLFVDLIKEAKERMRWYKEGLCYKCGGRVNLKENKLNSVYYCVKCGSDLYDDDIHHYYFNPLIKKLVGFEV